MNASVADVTPSDLEQIVASVDACPGVAKTVSVTALSDDAGEAVLAVRVELASEKSLPEAVEDIQAIRERIRETAPQVRTIYIEPDIYRPSNDPAPPTDVFVLRSED
jgi:divalent metal cation (Fe/Co/Zn/Cd) transporter